MTTLQPIPQPTPLPTPAPIEAGGRTFNGAANACFACTPAFQHERVWISDPEIADPKCPRSRTLVLCFDGTGASFNEDNSNVVQFLAMLKKDNPAEQLVYYQAGIGTYTNNVIKTPIRETVTKAGDMMIANSVGDHIQDGYEFLMQNYHAGDQICIFGFSRGAFTARALAGMLQKVGLLPPSNREQLPFAYTMYKKDDDDGRKLSSQFKRTFSVDVRIKFLGVWDTVQSVGVFPKHFPFSGSNNAIEVFRHALALDERRVKFFPSFCTSGGKRKDQQTNPADLKSNAIVEPETDVEEVFFAGAHCDVGGGSVENGTRHSLARIPLRWMIRECFNAHTGIIFDAHMLMNEVGLDMEMDAFGRDVKSISKAPAAVSSADFYLLPPPNTKSTSSSLTSALSFPFRWIWGKPPASDSSETKGRDHIGEDKEELNDALSPIYDQLEEHTYWKVMDWFPWVTEKQAGEAPSRYHFWGNKLVRNSGKGRIVYPLVMERPMKVHRSVKTRISAQGWDGEKGRYLPAVRCTIKGEKEPRCLKREEWLADKPEHFKWVD